MSAKTMQTKADLLATSEVKELLYQRFIAPTTRQRQQFAGIEIETPIVNLNSAPVDFVVVHSLTRAFAEQFGFLVHGLDNHGNILALECPKTGDLYTYDCSYNNLELSFGKVDCLSQVDARFGAYVQFIQQTLAPKQHCVTGMGINPNRNINWNVPLPTGRYRMLYHHLQSAAHTKAPVYFHPFYEYGMFTSASQVQIDIGYDQLLPTIKASDMLEPFKAVLFANSPLEFLGQTYLISRDMLWENSMQGFNPHNIGVFERPPHSTDELLDYLASLSIYCTERDGRYINFKPLPITEFFKTPQINGEHFLNGEYHSITFAPQLSDLEYLRTYKFADITFRGTIEFRSICTQPLRDSLAAPAFHLGLINQTEELLQVLENDKSIYGHGRTADELRKLLVLRQDGDLPLPEFVDVQEFQATLLKILELARVGLVKRSKGDEHYLRPLFARAQKLENPALQTLRLQEQGTSQTDIIQDFASL